LILPERKSSIEKFIEGYHRTTPLEWEWKTACYIYKKSQRYQGYRKEDRRRENMNTWEETHTIEKTKDT
jgi:hypothetical protein